MRARVRRLIRLPQLTRPRGERGSFAFAVVFWALMTMMLAGLVVDGGLAITERQRAGDIAEQAARAAAEDLDQVALHNGNYQLAGDYCTVAASVVTASGLDPSALVASPPGSIPGGGGGECPSGMTTLATGQTVPTVTITIHIHYYPILIGLFYSKQFDAYATATAHPQPGN